MNGILVVVILGRGQLRGFEGGDRKEGGIYCE